MTLKRRALRFSLFAIILIFLTKILLLIVDLGQLRSVWSNYAQQSDLHSLAALMIGIGCLIATALLAQMITLKIMPTGYKPTFLLKNSIKNHK